MTPSDWFNVAAFGVGLALIFVAGFWSGRLWERGEYVRKVMAGREPEPWEPDDEIVFTPGPAWELMAEKKDPKQRFPWEMTDEELRREFPPIRTRRAPYDWRSEDF